MPKTCPACGASLDGEDRCSARCFPVHEKACGHPKGKCRYCDRTVARTIQRSTALVRGFQVMIDLQTGKPHRCTEFRAAALSKTTERCAQCHEGIMWAESVNKKPIAVDIDGVPHFLTCAHNDLFKARKKGGQK